MTYFQFCLLLSSMFIALCNKDDRSFLGSVGVTWLLVAIIAGVLGK
jgi:hypothetical protein